MKALVSRLDPTRAVTAALNGAMEAQPNIADELDVVGFNYGRAAQTLSPPIPIARCSAAKTPPR
jgi:DNA-binding LacI/PurR family transcriptional regulator